MKQFIFITLSIITAIGTVPLSAQVDPGQYMPKDYSVIPPSPEVASLMKYTEIPVSYFSGLPQIDIPIYEVKEGKLSVPISLNYHGGGIKVTGVAGDVGLGWSLMAGGCISRTVYGHPDDMIKFIAGPKYIRGLFNPEEKDFKLRSYIMGQYAEFEPGAFNQATVKAILDTTLLWNKNYEDGFSDMANDVFQINCPGISGTFIYNDSKDIVLSSASPSSIYPKSAKNGMHPILGRIKELPSEYIVTDVSGTKYYFSHKEYTRHTYSYGAPGLPKTMDSIKYISAWHLTKIKNIENDSIIFYYKTKSLKGVDYGGSETRYYSSNYELKDYIAGSVFSPGWVYYYPESLSTIESSSVLVRFEYDQGNDHITGVRVETNDDKRTIVKKYRLDYGTFSGKKRLMLKSVNEISSDYFSVAPETAKSNTLYSFEYYDNGNLPFKFASQDFCGYYNGSGNRCLIPNLGPFMGGCDANRDVGIGPALYGSLTSITYPTGGKTIFEWEPNDFGYLWNIPVTKKSGTTEVITETDTLVGLIPSHLRKLVVDDYRITDKQNIYIDLTKYFAIDPTVLLNSGYYARHTWEEDGFINDYPCVVFIDKSDNKVKQVFYIDKYNTEKEMYVSKLSPGLYKIELRNPVNVDGTNEYFSRWFNGDTDCAKVYIRRRYDKTESTSVYKDYWGGLRIGAIMSVAGAECDTIVKEYMYCKTGDPNTSNGVISAYPYYNSGYTLLATNPLVTGIEESYITAASSNGLYKTPVGGQKVEYKTICERYSGVDRDMPNGSLHNLLIEYNYTSQYDFDFTDYNNSLFRDMQPRAAQMWTSRAHYRGNLVNKTIRNSGGSIIVGETNYSYNIHENPDLSVFSTDLFRIADYTRAPIEPGGVYQNLYGIGKYKLIPYNKTTRREENIVYDNNKKHITKTEYTYFYNEYTDSIDYGLVRSKRVTNSYGEVRETFYTYVETGAGFINLPESEVTVMDGIILSAKRMEYNFRNKTLKAVYGLSTRGISASGYNLGTSKKTSIKLIKLINKPEYSYRYDEDGNLGEIRYNGEVLASYLWGYRGMYPIAEIKGLPYDDLVAGIRPLGYTPESLLSSTAYTEPYLSNFLNNLRSVFPTYEVTTMTYHWLIGVSTATDARGVTTHFTFDDFGRLSDVKDYNGYFIRKYDYHYAEPE